MTRGKASFLVSFIDPTGPSTCGDDDPASLYPSFSRPTSQGKDRLKKAQALLPDWNKYKSSFIKQLQVSRAIEKIEKRLQSLVRIAKLELASPNEYISLLSLRLRTYEILQ